jgi:hypothetical protein
VTCGVLRCSVVTPVFDADFEEFRQLRTYKNFRYEDIYFKNYRREMGDYMGNYYLLYKGYLSVLQYTKNILCLPSYRPNKMNLLLRLVSGIAH